MSAKETAYRHLPRIGQHVAVSAYGLYWHWLRFGRGYRRELRGFREREALDESKLERWVHKRLLDVLESAARASFYRDHWTRDQMAAARRGALRELPLLEKAPLRAEPRQFLSRPGHRRSEWTFHTSGSTGTPLASIWTIDEIRRSIALREARSANWAGVSFRDPRATFSGRLVEPDPDASASCYRFNARERQVYFSAFHLSPERAHLYLDALRRHGSVWITGYAVSIYLLAKFALERDLEAPALEAAITTSEKLTPRMRRTISEAFDCPVFEEYSSVENILFASECERGSLHVSPDAGIIEILRPDGSPCEPEEPGEVVATGLLRDHQPMVRFRLGDSAAWASGPCDCGRSFPVLEEVVGRIEDVVVGPDGRQMVRLDHTFRDMPKVAAGQIVQRSVTDLLVRVVAGPTFDPDDEAEIKRRIRQRLGSSVSVEVETVEQIERTPAGKFRAVISQLDESETTGLSREGAPIA